MPSATQSPSACLPASVPGQGSGLEQLQTGNFRVALVTQASPCLIPHRQTPTNSPTLFSAHCSGFTSPSAIGLPAPQSPHLPTRIGYRLFPFLYGQGQGTLGNAVLKYDFTCF
ncbi:hypothetical protein G5714_021720 [Onychostoma macrolepis]|uniref:Uncharacterized protein n=1 Tax=Onychostoma macrolepis TaxID=369639 RepID=A0A7J6BVI0_9TELE|nr:hypothetical protein G5714_021720 [Onychostoma macrolepis]